MPLFKNGAPIEDAWTMASDNEPLPEGPAIVGLLRFLGHREALLAHEGPLGLTISPGEALSEIAADLGRFDLVVLTFPKYTDGRAYSTARLLRERYGFKGELRAAGNVLQDQLAFMHRCGFDAFDVTHMPTLQALKEGRVPGVLHHYQPGAVSEAVPAGPPWRRLSETVL